MNLTLADVTLALERFRGAGYAHSVRKPPQPNRILWTGFVYLPKFRGGGSMTLTIEIEQEADGRWLAEVPSLPGVMTYGQTQTDAFARVQALALRVLAERLEHGEAVPELLNLTFRAA